MVIKFKDALLASRYLGTGLILPNFISLPAGYVYQSCSIWSPFTGSGTGTFRTQSDILDVSVRMRMGHRLVVLILVADYKGNSSSQLNPINSLYTLKWIFH